MHMYTSAAPFCAISNLVTTYDNLLVQGRFRTEHLPYSFHPSDISIHIYPHTYIYACVCVRICMRMRLYVCL